MKLDEAVNFLERVKNIEEDRRKEGYIGETEIIEPIKVVLEALKNSTPKKKIEDRIKELWKEKQELQDEYSKNIDKWIEEGTKAANEHKDRLTPYIPALEEIRIEQKMQHILGAIRELEKIVINFRRDKMSNTFDEMIEELKKKRKCPKYDIKKSNKINK